MAEIASGRWSAASDAARHDGLVLFHIGMRINRWRAVRAWWPVFAAMAPMLSELARHPELGMLGAQSHWSGRTLMVVQYWRDLDALTGYSRAADRAHLPAWQAFNRAARAARAAGDRAAAVGIFHETYLIGAGQSEAVYVNMPVAGLAGATAHVPVGRRGDTAIERLAAR